MHLRVRNVIFTPRNVSGCAVFCILELTSMGNRSLVTEAPQIGALFAFSWFHSKFYPSVDNLSEFLTKMQNSTTDDSWNKGLKLLMSEAADARDVAKMCIRYMRMAVVDEALEWLVALTSRFVNHCSEAVFTELQDQWTRLLLSLARACERQLCSGDEAHYQEWIMPWILPLIKYVCQSGLRRRRTHTYVRFSAVYCSVNIPHSPRYIGAVSRTSREWISFL